MTMAPLVALAPKRVGFGGLLAPEVTAAITTVACLAMLVASSKESSLPSAISPSRSPTNWWWNARSKLRELCCFWALFVCRFLAAPFREESATGLLSLNLRSVNGPWSLRSVLGPTACTPWGRCTRALIGTGVNWMATGGNWLATGGYLAGHRVQAAAWRSQAIGVFVKQAAVWTLLCSRVQTHSMT
eukprot:CAMPEP_0198207740 /NCGR_PEP_ID=MMETSP1445-20131203/11168_1 /TAXON_ID=36898 /ORGANISM="Pyramimonas sp., Strain CCMP2087" /LENGTH=186 /DNA_ID=CAMNT_0043880881 /DNA_START=777 /DNA_END=1332 /DNA_ORIENTATION=-